MFSISSLLVTALGAVAMAQADVPVGIWISNMIAWPAAMGAAIVLARGGWLGSWLPPVALVVVALSFVGPEQEGVHRWLGFNQIQFNAAALVLPAAIVAFDRTRAVVAGPSFVVIAALLAWQPDLSQLAGFALAATILATARFGWPGLVAALVLTTAAIAACLSRPDPLDAVPYVERIFALAVDQSPVLALAMGLSLTAAVLSPLIVWPTHPFCRATPVALSAYFAATAIAPMFGAFPVPLAGYGVSFVIGWGLGFAGLVPCRKK